MKSLIFTNPATKESLWCVSGVEEAINLNHYIVVVDLGFRDNEYYNVENFKWVDQLTNITPQTHKWDGDKFVKLPDVAAAE